MRQSYQVPNEDSCKTPQNLQVKVEEPVDKSTDESIFQRIKSLLFNVSVEPLMLLVLVPSMMASLATENLNLEKACRVNLEYDEKVCNAMVLRNTSGYTPNQEIKVQQLVSTWLAYKTAIQGIVPFLLMIFLGSWSDRHGKRRPFILMPIFGESISTIGFLICTYFFLELSVEYAIFFEAVPPALSGGWFCFFVGIYSYVGGKSDVNSKTLKVGSAAMVCYMSVTIGIALSGVTYRAVGYYGVYCLALFFYALSIMYGFHIIKDDIPGDALNQNKVKDGPKKPFLLDLFDIKHIKNTFSICFKEGPNNRKKKICGIMVLVLVIVGPFRGEISVMYMFTRRKFTWDELSYSGFNTFHSVTQVLGGAFCLTVFIKWMKIDDATLGMIAMTSKVVGSIGYGLAPGPLYFYMAALTEVFNSSSHIAMRSIMSKLVSVQELGQTNSLFGMCEALTPLFCGPLYSFVYNHTVAYFPGAFFLLSALFHIAAFFIFLWIYMMHRREQKNAEVNFAGDQRYSSTVSSPEGIQPEIFYEQNITRSNNKNEFGIKNIHKKKVTDAENVPQKDPKEIVKYQHDNRGFITD